MAAGDIALTTPRSIPNLVLIELNIGFLPTPVMTVTFAEVNSAGTSHSVRITDTSATGFDYSAGAFTDGVPRVISNEYTAMVGILFGAGASTPNQRKTAGVQRCFTSGVITATATVG